MIEIHRHLPVFGTGLLQGYIPTTEIPAYRRAATISPGVVFSTEPVSDGRSGTIWSNPPETNVRTPLVPVELCFANRISYLFFKSRLKKVQSSRATAPVHPRHTKGN